MLAILEFTRNDTINMISPQYFLDPILNYEISDIKDNLPGYIKLLFDEMTQIKRNLPKFYDPTACLIAVTRPLIELTMINVGLHDHDLSSQSIGRTPISLVSLMQIHLLATIHEIGSYRHVERVINAYQSWLHALHLRKAPHHSTLGKFRQTLGSAFFDRFFDELFKIMIDAHIINPENIAVNIDSAPFKACMNFARANSDLKVDYSRLEQLFKKINWKVIQTQIPHINLQRKKSYTPEMLLKFLLFEQLGGFLSRSQALCHVKKHAQAYDLIGFSPKKFPTQPTISNFAKMIGGPAEIIALFKDSLFNFFAITENSLDFKDFPHFFLEDVE